MKHIHCGRVMLAGFVFSEGDVRVYKPYEASAASDQNVAVVYGKQREAEVQRSLNSHSFIQTIES